MDPGLKSTPGKAEPKIYEDRIIDFYKDKIKKLKVLLSKAKKEDKDVIKNKIISSEKELKKFTIKYERYATSSFLKNAYVNNFRDMSLRKLQTN